MFGEDVFDDQKDYLLAKKTPKSMGAAEWIERIEVEAIDDCLGLLDKETDNMSDREL